MVIKLGKDWIPIKRLFELFDMLPCGISVATDRSCQEIFHNSKTARFLSIQPWSNLRYPISNPSILRNGKIVVEDELPLQRAARNDCEVANEELEFIWEDGTRKVAILNARPFHDDRGEVAGVLATWKDITQHKQFEWRLEDILGERTHQLDAAHAKIDVILNGITEGCFILDQDWRMEYVNPIAAKMWGYTTEELVGRTIWEQFPGLLNSQLDVQYHRAVDENIPVHFDTMSPVVHCWIEVHAYPVQQGLLIFFRDIHEQKIYEQELARLANLELIGQMAAGISHEVRNPITTVKGFLQFFLNKPPFDSAKEHIELMISELDRANAILSEFLSISKTDTVEFSSQNLNDIIGLLQPLLAAHAMKEGKELAIVTDDVPAVLLNGPEIRQLILNLVRNATEAMRDHGTVTIKTYCDDNDVVLSVNDQGGGIDPSILEKIWTPFFTTKPQGTGLGLALCMGIAARHKARIEVESGSAGTTFLVRFPKSVCCIAESS